MTNDDEEIPIGWELVSLTDDERDALIEAADSSDIEAADAIAEAAYSRLFGELVS